ncbi:MAG: hypothetical protein JSV03_14495 [Planctomycetota bacterium]|nr:MAG: hypothetical protein JSV03_14495 [Planctomycetota bacterium]
MSHQLWSLWHMRVINKDPRVTDQLLEELCRRIARENTMDLRANDLYFERAAFILMAGHPEMIKRRWIERIIENQNNDGGWRDPWYFFGSTGQWGHLSSSNSHSTMLALWALYRVRYVYSEQFGLPGIQAGDRNTHSYPY